MHLHLLALSLLVVRLTWIRTLHVIIAVIGRHHSLGVMSVTSQSILHRSEYDGYKHMIYIGRWIDEYVYPALPSSQVASNDICLLCPCQGACDGVDRGTRSSGRAGLPSALAWEDDTLERPSLQNTNWCSSLPSVKKPDRIRSLPLSATKPLRWRPGKGSPSLGLM